MSDKVINGSLKVTGGLVDSNNNTISVDNISTLSGNNTFTGNNTHSGTETFNNEIELDKEGTSGNSKWHIEEDVYSQLVFSRTYNGNKDMMYTMNGSSFLPKLDNTGALGSSSKKFSDLFVYKVNKMQAILV